MMLYQKAKAKANNDGAGDGDGGELEVADVAGEGLGDDVHGEQGQAGEDGRADDLP